ncbi:MAG: hypothetical protein ACDS79_19115, partial [Enterobacteriaceae bacterium]
FHPQPYYQLIITTMAKGNLFQGMARGKVGDVVFSRLNGQQISRVRNRAPKNPRTEKQLWQRAIMATIMQAYAAGKEIFDHAYQGYAVGANCQREFMRLNTRALRSKFASEVNNTDLTPEETVARAIAPGNKTSVPNEYIISSGSYDQNLFVKTITKTLDVVTGCKFNLPAAANANETLAEYAERVGLITGDIYTLVAFITDSTDVLFRTYGIESLSYDTVYRTRFYFTRFIVKDVSSSTTKVSEAHVPDLFEIESNTEQDWSTSVLSDDFDYLSLIPASLITGNEAHSIGMIRSRRDLDLRSNTTMTAVHPDNCGLWNGDVIEAWKKGTEPLGNSTLILEGGDEEED